MHSYKKSRRGSAVSSRIASTGLVASALAVAVYAMLGPAAAQSEADFIKALAGKWSIVDPRFGVPSGPCSMTLMATGAGGRYDLATLDCGGELASVAKWGIVDNQLALLDSAQAVLARLGGNQRRISGTTAKGVPIVLDRVDIQDNAATTIQRALKASGCFYLGFSRSCASFADLASPLAVPDANGRSVSMLANVNVRAEPRDDSPVSGVAERGSCVAVTECLTAADGVWCQAKSGPKTGWIRKIAIRQSRWPIVTFTNECKANPAQ